MPGTRTQQMPPAEPDLGAMRMEQFVEYMRNRTPEQIEAARAEMRGGYRPRPLPPGKTLEDVFVGALPDDKTDEEIDAAIAEIE